MKLGIRLLVVLVLLSGAFVSGAGAQSDSATPPASSVLGCDTDYSTDTTLESNLSVLPGSEGTAFHPPVTNVISMYWRTVLVGADAHSFMNCFNHSVFIEVKQGSLHIRTLSTVDGVLKVWPVGGQQASVDVTTADGELELRAGDRVQIHGVNHQIFTGADEGAVIEVTVIVPAEITTPCGPCLTYP